MVESKTAARKEAESTLAAQVRRASRVRPGDVAEAEMLACLVAEQLRAAGPDRASGLHRISPLAARRLTHE